MERATGSWGIEDQPQTSIKHVGVYSILDVAVIIETAERFREQATTLSVHILRHEGEAYFPNLFEHYNDKVNLGYEKSSIVPKEHLLIEILGESIDVGKFWAEVYRLQVDHELLQ